MTMGNWDIARQALISPTNDSVLRERITELLAETAEMVAQGKHLRESAIFAIQTQIDRALMWEKRAIAAEAENAELRRLMTVQNDWITELNGKLAAFTNVAPKPEPAHNPFRDFPTDPRRMGP